MLFLWIDDEPRRERAATNFEKSTKIKIKFCPVNGKDLMKELKTIRDTVSDPDLILIDHRLDKVLGGVIHTGSTAAEILREKWNDCPIACVTAVDIEDIPLHRQAIYDDVIASESFSDNYSSLIAIANSYKMMKRDRPKDVNGILKLLLAPKSDNKRLKSIMPEDIKGHLGDKSLLTNISKWVRDTLLTKPGFLYDGLWTATLLGIREASFSKVQKIFEKAKYTGIFSDDNNKRWWQSQLREILYFKVKDNNANPPWVLGHKLPNITKKDHSICHVCGKELPETVAYIDVSSKRREPMHLRCTVGHPSFESSLFFEEIRMMKVAE